MTYDRTARRPLLATVLLAVALVTSGCGDDDRDQAQVRTPAPQATQVPTGPPLAAGEHEVQVLLVEGDVLVLDVGRFVVGEPTEPGVDSTAPIGFDTNGQTENLRVPVASGAELTAFVPGTGISEVTAEQLAAAVNGGAEPFHATVTVEDGEVVDLEQLYRA